MRARVPASSANLGPGLDTLALALSLYTEVTVEPAASLSIRSEGTGASFPVGVDHLAARVVRSVLGHDRVHIEISSDIPAARGLGSSAALAVAVAAAAGCDDPLTLAARLEGHPDNAAACVLGGFLTAMSADGVVHAARLPLDPQLAFVVVIPERSLNTSTARSALPSHVPLEAALANLASMGALIAGFADASALGPWASIDRLHQPFRAPLFPESEELLRALVAEGARMSCWSGAGSTLLAVCDRASAASVRSGGEQALLTAGVPGVALVVEPDLVGLVVSSDT